MADGLSRFSLPLIILLSIVFPVVLFQISEKYPSLRSGAAIVGLLILICTTVFSSDLLFQMSGKDPRLEALTYVNAERTIYFIDEIGWDFGLFTQLKDKVEVVSMADLHNFDGKLILFTDYRVNPQAPFPNEEKLRLERVIRPRKLLNILNDSSYLHDYRYFSPTVYIYRIIKDGAGIDARPAIRVRD